MGRGVPEKYAKIEATEDNCVELGEIGQKIRIRSPTFSESTFRTFEIQIEGTSFINPYVAQTTPLTCTRESSNLMNSLSDSSRVIRTKQKLLLLCNLSLPFENQLQVRRGFAKFQITTHHHG